MISDMVKFIAIIYGSSCLTDMFIYIVDNKILISDM
jgi:hypothetical protein